MHNGIKNSAASPNFMNRFLAAALFLPAMLMSAAAAETTFTSAATRTHLLELYTSEGCSSCPPAEQWFSKLTDAPGLWRNFVPLAFHVDYWDRLGWRDPFAAKKWTARQYDYAARWQNGSVYTPGFALDGREWRVREVPGASNETAGVLKISSTGGERWSVVFQPTKPDGRALEVHLARLGFGLRTDVKAGENRGRQLQHDFVVLALADAPLASGRAEISVPESTVPQAAKARQAIAAWVTEKGQMEPLQAVGGWRE